MPITTTDEQASHYLDANHWDHVLSSLFVPAIETAGMEFVSPVTEGSELIHGHIIRQLSEADLVLCDLSAHNPNVFFELGVRTSINKPVALVCDQYTSLPFDTGVINTYRYESGLNVWDIEEARATLTRHITQSKAAGNGDNPLWRQFGLTIRAEAPELTDNPLEAKIDLLASDVRTLRNIASHASTTIETVPVRHNPEDPESWPAWLFVNDASSSGLGGTTQMSVTSATDVQVRVARTPTASEMTNLQQLAKVYGVRLSFRVASSAWANREQKKPRATPQ